MSLHHHLPELINRVISIARHGNGIFRSTARIVEVGFCRLPGVPRSWRKSRGRRRRIADYPSRGAGTGPLLLHYHIFKNAGLSYEFSLEQNFGERFRRYDEAPGTVLSGDDILDYVMGAPELAVVSSHQGTLPAPNIPGRDIVTSILIRDPIARIRSIYSFERRQKKTLPGSTRAKELDFKGYVEWRLATAPWILCNFQVHFCSRTKATKRFFMVDESHLQKAIANLDAVHIVGTVKRYSDWLALAQIVLAEKFPDISLKVVRKNVSDTNREKIDETTILDELVRDLGHDLADRLLQANELDMFLHQVADALLTRRLAERGADSALRNAYADARKRLWTSAADGDPKIS